MDEKTYYSLGDQRNEKKMNNGNIAGGAYGMGFIGAVIYYITHAVTFWAGVLGFFKAIFWPAFLIYHLLEFLKM